MLKRASPYSRRVSYQMYRLGSAKHGKTAAKSIPCFARFLSRFAGFQPNSIA